MMQMIKFIRRLDGRQNVDRQKMAEKFIARFMEQIETV